MSISSKTTENDESDSQLVCQSSKKRPRPSDMFYEAYVCPICYEFLTPPVIRCSQDHNFCLTCIDRMELLSGGSRCPNCRIPINKDNRNRFVEEQLEQLFVYCKYKDQGCVNKIPLSRREKHEKFCEFCPGTVKCYFGIQPFPDKCEWIGRPTALINHLGESHKIETIEREFMVRFLWNPPNKEILRVRPRILKIKFPCDGTPFSFFILEHVYNPQYKVALFLVRSLDSGLKLNYSIDLIDRNNQDIGLTFRGITMDFSEFQLDDYPNCELKRVFQIPYDLIESFTFKNTDENEYFSFHVGFDIPIHDSNNVQ